MGPLKSRLTDAYDWMKDHKWLVISGLTIVAVMAAVFAL